MHNLDPVAVCFLIVFGFLVPLAVIQGRSHGRGGIGIPPLPKQASQIVLMELFFLLVALAAARARRIDVFALGSLPIKAILLAAVVLILGLVTLPLRWKTLSAEQRRKSLATRPQKPGDLGPWFAVSLAAGIVEETVYRGVMMALLLPRTRNWWLSVVICVLLFALGHLNQSAVMVVMTLVPMATAMHFLVAWTGSLYLAMTVHFLYNFLAGFVFIRIARKHLAACTWAAQPSC